MRQTALKLNLERMVIRCGRVSGDNDDAGKVRIIQRASAGGLLPQKIASGCSDVWSTRSKAGNDECGWRRERSLLWSSPCQRPPLVARGLDPRAHHKNMFEEMDRRVEARDEHLYHGAVHI